jgi:hypothetical protein
MRAAGFIGVILALGAALLVYNAQLTQSGVAATSSPQAQIDVTGIRASLLEIGQAQRLYVVGHGAYGTLAELRADGAPELGGDRRGYAFEVATNGTQGFKVTATPTDPDKAGWPTLTIDETMQIASH